MLRTSTPSLMSCLATSEPKPGRLEGRQENSDDTSLSSTQELSRHGPWTDDLGAA
ncbi:predicted protein [Histoplasma capsulatum var. duboisii H88]|uniref:Predicted protein n=1 Tax=Ajellomyces capsulatus (strain H88) TaxID=544711 RepID=F0UME1_AJEC8|nr:predicted protein [Histoplasma capsulatum var. duboisii H88]QSS54282.1 hypothetical protein I7I53_01785 [Histoplasma capsulatum var. duboisii H88]